MAAVPLFKVKVEVRVGRLVEAFKKNNALVERAASLIAADNATMQLQFERLVRESHYEQRRVFRDAGSALAFSSDTLDERERVRAAAFVNEWVG